MFLEMILHCPLSLGASGPEGHKPKYHSIQFNSPSVWLSTIQHHIPEDQHPHTAITTSKHTHVSTNIILPHNLHTSHLDPPYRPLTPIFLPHRWE